MTRADAELDAVAYTDGGCRGNPGPGAWAFLLIDPKRRAALERAGGDAATTNNRMEMLAAIEALRALRPRRARVLVWSDSQYLIHCCTQWLEGWKARGWRRRDGELKNVDLLKELDALIARHDVRWRWVEGHAGDRGNEHVDRLANEAMDRLARGEPAAFERRGRWP
jgi:ribonuclease HI